MSRVQKVILNGKDFKKLVAGVTKFPGLGTFAGSDIVSLKCDGERLFASSSGVVLAIGSKKAKGKLDLCGIDERALGNFAGVVSEGSDVSIEMVGKEFALRSRSKKLTPGVLAGVDHKAPELPETKVKIAAESAERIRYLAAIAYNDATKPELCCVMLSKGKATAMDQKLAAVLKVGIGAEGRIPLPLTLASAIEAGNSLYVDSRTTALRAGSVVYSVPSMTKALTEYPFGVIKTLRESSGKTLATVAGSKLAGAIDDCLKVLGNLARTESIAVVGISDGFLRLTGISGGVSFFNKFAAVTLDARNFRVPLASLGRVRPFLSGEIEIRASKHNDLFLWMGKDWVMFPGEEVAE